MQFEKDLWNGLEVKKYLIIFGQNLEISAIVDGRGQSGKTQLRSNFRLLRVCFHRGFAAIPPHSMLMTDLNKKVGASQKKYHSINEHLPYCREF